MPIHHHKVENSSAIEHCMYDPQEKLLTIKFVSGSSHTFEDVPQAVFDGVKKTESVGKYFHSTIRGKYNERK